VGGENSKAKRGRKEGGGGKNLKFLQLIYKKGKKKIYAEVGKLQSIEVETLPLI